MDILFINGLAFLHIKSKSLNYVTIQSLHQVRRFQHIVPKLKFIVAYYIARGFIIFDVFTDNEFDSDKFRQVFLPANLHIYTQSEHVTIIVRSIRSIKERVRATLQGLLYTTLPRLMYMSLLERVKCILNDFPAPSEPQSLFPIMLVEGKSQYYVKKTSFPFGTPVNVYTSSVLTSGVRSQSHKTSLHGCAPWMEFCTLQQWIISSSLGMKERRTQRRR